MERVVEGGFKGEVEHGPDDYVGVSSADIKLMEKNVMSDMGPREAPSLDKVDTGARKSMVDSPPPSLTHPKGEWRNVMSSPDVKEFLSRAPSDQIAHTEALVRQQRAPAAAAKAHNKTSLIGISDELTGISTRLNDFSAIIKSVTSNKDIFGGGRKKRKKSYKKRKKSYKKRKKTYKKRRK